MELLRSLANEDEHAVVAVTHDHRATRFADRLLVLQDGQIMHDQDILGLADRTLSGRFGVGGWIARRTEVKPEDLQASFKRFLSAMHNAFSGLEAKVAGYTLEELEIEVEISAEGEVRLLGSGGSSEEKAALLSDFGDNRRASALNRRAW
jgi:energy-coupling factor transporter ATP-binding protein EcfA2